jgi:hypothetical protein
MVDAAGFEPAIPTRLSNLLKLLKKGHLWTSLTFVDVVSFVVSRNGEPQEKNGQ